MSNVINERDKKILKALDCLRVLDIDTIQKLCSFTSYSSCARRMTKIQDNGYVEFYQESKFAKKYYTISQKGMNYLYGTSKKIASTGREYIKKKKPPNFSKRTLEHEITVAKVLARLIECNNELTIEDFQTERNLQSRKEYNRNKREHLCDLLCEKYRIKVEVELSLKNKKDLILNFYANSTNYVQLWIVGTNQIYKRISKLKEENNSFCVFVIKLEDFNRTEINLSDLEKVLYETNEDLKNHLKQLEYLQGKKENRVEQLSIDSYFDFK